MPADAHDWITVALCMARMLPGQLRIFLPFEDGPAAAAAIPGRISGFPNERGILATRDVILAQSELRERDLMLRGFVRNRSHTPTVTRSPGFLLGR